MRVLVIEDSAPTRDLLVRSLEDADMTVVTTARVSTGLRAAMSEAFDVIVLDLMLPDLSGNERQYVLECLDSTWISSKGKFIQQFESGIADFIGHRIPDSTIPRARNDSGDIATGAEAGSQEATVGSDGATVAVGQEVLRGGTLTSFRHRG